MKKGKKEMIFRLILFLATILIAISYFPIKKAVYADAVYADENDARINSKQNVLYWFNYKTRDDYNRCIIETSGFVDHPELKETGWSYIGEFDAHEIPTYYNAQGFEFQGHKIRGTSPLIKLNSSFDPIKVKNYFAIKYESFYEQGLGEMKEGYYVVPIIIYDWTPIYPIQRSGTLANLLLPKSYLTIWDFIG